MAKLKLGPIADDKPVKLTIELPAGLPCDLVVYGHVLSQEAGQAAIEPAKLIAPVLMRFIATDVTDASAPPGGAGGEWRNLCKLRTHRWTDGQCR